jgi:hypothetical protein
MATDFIKERNEAVIEAFKGDYKKLYAYMLKWNGRAFYENFKSETNEVKRATVCKMICSIVSEEITPYKHEAEQWLIKKGMKPWVDV